MRYDVEMRTLVVERHSGRELRSESVLDYCRDRLARLRTDAPELPFDFTCGFAGYLGFELKAECGGRPAHAAALPDAALMLCDRLIAFDHAERHVYLLALADPSGTEAACAWLATTRERLGEIACEPPPLPPPPAPPGTLRFELHDSPEAYLANIAACRREIIEGETYEVCLTTELRSDGSLDPLRAYRALRARNPAPFAALLRLGEQSVLSSSPERFLRVDRDGVVESRPMKGTAARVAEPFEDACRAAELRRDKKTRAENLMIADLVRNDLGRVSALGTVEVPALMIVEPYATVHQMVTVVRGRLREGSDAIDCVRAAFPPGSMTGAPKLRTLEIIDRIEGRPRGVYSGALGFFAVNGTADLNVVIRTLVASPDGLRIGAGGAIVAASDPEAELEEMLLKARPVLATVGGTLEVGDLAWLTDDGPPSLPPQNEDLAAPQLEAVSAPARVAALDLLVGQRQSQPAQVAQVQAQEERPVRAREGEGGQQRHLRHGHDRAPPHARPGRGAEPAESDDRARQHAQPRGLPHAPRDGDQPAPQAGADLVAGVALDEDLAAAHPGSLARQRTAELVPGGAPHDEPAAAHARAREIPHVSFHDQLASPHLRAGVHSRIARDGQPAGRHARPDELDAPQVPSTRSSSSPSPETVKKSASRACRLPCQTVSVSISPRGRPASRSGLRPSVSSGTVGGSRRVSVSGMSPSNTGHPAPNRDSAW